MKRALLTDSVREIKSTMSRFLAIVAIVALSIAFFTGIKVSCPDMQHTGDVYFDAHNLMDFRLISTVGLNSEDIQSIRKTQGVEGVFPAYTVDALIKYGNKEVVSSVHSLPSLNNRKGMNYINVPMVLEGRLPQQSGECVVEELFFSDLKLGQKIKLSSGKENKDLETLRSDTMTVVGIVRSPLYISRIRGNSTIGNGKIESYIYVTEEEFDLPVYNEVYLTMKGGKLLDTYSQEYKTMADNMEEKLENLADERVKIRYDDIVGNATDEYNQGKVGFNKAVKNSIASLELAEKEYELGKKELSAAKFELGQAEEEVNKQEQMYSNEIASGLYAIESNERQINSQIETIKDAISKARLGGYYNSQGRVLESSYTQLLKAKSELENAKSALRERQLDLEENISFAREELKASKEQLLKANENIIFSESKLIEGRNSANKSLFIANSDLTNALEEIRDIKDVKWHVLSREKNIGFADYEGAALRMDAISKVFPLLFVFVAILICLTTMGRMVEEQRGYIGTLKALGYSSYDILSKYLIYATSASVVGSVVGIAFGFKFFPGIIYNAYRELYVMPDLIYLFDIPLALSSVFVAVLFTCGAAIFVCYEALTSNCAQLLRPKSPKAGTKIFLERVDFIWSRLKFTQKVTARNLLRYKSRFFMTVIGVAGCSALLVVGFGLKDAISYIGHAQYGEIFNYDISLSLTEDEDKKEQVIREVEAINNINGKMEAMMINVNAENTMNFDATMVIPKDIRNFPKYIKLQDRVLKNNLSIDNEGIIISEKLAKLLGVKIGDSIYIKADDYQGYNLTIQGLTENYFDHYIYISPKLFQETFVEEDLEWNSLLLNLEKNDNVAVDTVSRRLLDIDGVGTVQKNYVSKNEIGNTITSINFIVVILIVCAGLLSFIVLYTLTNINVSERIREIATIKVLGFYDKETAAYVFRENVILSFIGSLVGLVLGRYLCLFVILTAEVEILMFGRDIKTTSFLISMAITLFFSMMVNVIMLKKIKNINMVEALKTVE